MKDAETKLKCLELRAQGKSLSTIADTVGVRRQTVANWIRQYAEEVQNLKAMELDALRETFWMSKQTRIEQFKARLELIAAEVERRGFSDVPTETLLELELKARDALEKELFGGSYIRSEDELKAAKVARTSPRKDDWGILSLPGDYLFRGSSREESSGEDRPEVDTTLLIEPEKNGHKRKRSSRAG